MLRPSFPRSTLGVVAAALLMASSAVGADRGGLRLSFPPLPVTATEDAKWRVPIKVLNDLDEGVFGDSLACEIHDLDPGLTGAGRLTRGTSAAISSVLKSLGEHDSTMITFTGAASCDRARLSFRLFVHTSDGSVHEATGSCETGPSLISRSFGSSFIVDKARRVETVLVPERWPQRPSPGVLLVHPEGSHARRMLPLAWTLANAGYSVMMVSLPGYGQSTGPADFGGPASVRALSLALDALRRSPQVDSSRIAVWGISRGATAAAMLATERHDLAGLVLQSGVYDPQTAYRTTQSDSMRRALKKEGRSEGGWSRRSATRAASHVETPVLFIHGDRDVEAIPNQALDLGGKLRAAGAEVQIELIPGAGHAIASNLSYPLVIKFLKPLLHPAK